MAAELGDEVMMFDSHYVIKFGKITSRNQDGSVEIEDHDGGKWTAEAVAAYRVLPRLGREGEESSDGITQQESNTSQPSPTTTPTGTSQSNSPPESESALQKKSRRRSSRK